MPGENRARRRISVATIIAVVAVVVALVVLSQGSDGSRAATAAATTTPAAAATTTPVAAATTTPAAAATTAPTAAATTAVAATTTTTGAATAPIALSIRVSGNHLVNGAGSTVQLRGVDRSGTEYACVQGWGVFDGPADAASVAAMASWGVNAVRIPLNEDCWLGINGVKAAYAGTNYQQAIINYVHLLNSYGIYAILDLHWSAPGTTLATQQEPMPDKDHSPAFWASVAATFESNPAVIFDLFNEPYPDSNNDSTAAWTCWRDGGTCSGVSYPVAGMQELVDLVRSTGADNVLMLGGIQYANTLDHWGTYEPIDPLGQLAASFHNYDFNTCTTEACWNAWLGDVNGAPLITGEVGLVPAYVTSYLNWANPKGVGYLAWAWDAWGCPNDEALVSDYSGTPCPSWGATYQADLAAAAPPPTAPTTAPTTTLAPTTTTTTTTTPPAGKPAPPPTPPPAVTTFTARPGVPIKEGQSEVLSATLSAPGTPLPNRPVTLQFRPTTSATWTGAAHVTSAAGRVQAAVKPVHNEVYRWSFAGAAGLKPSTSAATTVTVAQTLTIARSATTIVHGRTVTLYGTVSPAETGRPVYAYRLVKARWVRVAGAVIRAQVLPNHRRAVGYAIPVRLASIGTYSLRTFRAATATNAAGWSATTTVRTR